ncbi:MAG: preprotein translocase subunit SecE [Chlamydiae bacterium]|nr:preprotein translocase subunit SecE [Chlamydiota bacterium]
MEEVSISLVQETKSQMGRGYIREFKEELKKVSWTSKEELFLSTKIVVGSTFVFGFGVYLVDLVVQGSLNGLHSLVFKVIG